MCDKFPHKIKPLYMIITGDDTILCIELGE